MLKPLAVVMTLSMLSLTGFSRPAAAQDHVVPLSEVHRDLQSAAGRRSADIAEIERLLSSPAARDELSRRHLDSAQVRKAVSLLNDDELARLAARARAADQDVQGGLIKTVLAIIGAITVIVILIAVLA